MSIHARYLFNSREQAPFESLDDYLSSLSSLSSKCHYDASPSFIQCLIRDRLIVGIRNKEVQSRLLNCSDDTKLESVLSIAKSHEIKIKQEQNEDEDLPSLHDKLQVQVKEVQCRPDVRVTEEAKIAILIELMNHKSIMLAPSGHENEKAQLWNKVYSFAKSIGTSFKSALHLREVFGTWKNLALQSKLDNNQDLKATNADKLIWDLFSQDDPMTNLEDYPDLNSNSNEHEFNEGDEENELFTFDENDLESTSNEDNDSENEVIKPVARRRRGRPRKESPTRSSSSALSTESKILVLKTCLLHKSILSAKGHEKDKKDAWKSIYNALEQKQKLNIDNPSSLRGAFRLWKQRAVKKRENPDEIVTESDKLIYEIFDLASSKENYDGLEDDIKEEVIEENSGVTFIAYTEKLAILHEICKFRNTLGLNIGSGKKKTYTRK